MQLKNTLFMLALSLVAPQVIAGPDWSEGHTLEAPRPNPFGLPEGSRIAGRLHAQIYPVEITGSLPPFEATRQMIEGGSDHPFRRFISKIIQGFGQIQNFSDIEKQLGLHPYPLDTDRGVYSVPFPNGVRPDSRMGMGLIERHNAKGFTFSCAACHSARLFDKTILGLTNRFPGANQFFIQGKKAISAMTPAMFKAFSAASNGEVALYRETRNNIQFVGLKEPLQLGLDTSVAQVALSLNRRAQDEWAEKDPWVWPREDRLDHEPADSKPAVWWNLKYKNRWLSDGSVVAGNPIFTNILWNEIGRGVDLKELSIWLKKNTRVIEELTTAAFASEAPPFTDFFPYADLDGARRGEKIFNRTCARCHGLYEKNPSTMATTRVVYPSPTRVMDVGTDPYRWRGMTSLTQLNDLAISKENGLLIRPQKGYVPPPVSRYMGAVALLS